MHFETKDGKTLPAREWTGESILAAISAAIAKEFPENDLFIPNISWSIDRRYRDAVNIWFRWELDNPPAFFNGIGLQIPWAFFDEGQELALPKTVRHTLQGLRRRVERK